jgi:cyanophycinase-like exopeptidase
VNGRLIIMGSGETGPGLVATHRAGILAAGAERVVVIDTPFGFQENAAQLREKLVTFFQTSLNVPADIAGLRSRDADVADRERALDAIRSADYVFAGPGSPSYALEVWAAMDMSAALHRVISGGGTVTFASAAALTLGRTTIPVYEIYKVGAEPFWLDGLDLMTELGLPCSVVPHWNNAEGGNHDTSRCYIGERRLGRLRDELRIGLIGVDEHTAAILDFGEGTLRVVGRGGVTLRGDDDWFLPSGSTTELGPVSAHLGAPEAPISPPANPEPEEVRFEQAMSSGDADGLLIALLQAEERAQEDPASRVALRSMLVRLMSAAESGLADPRTLVSGFVDVIIDQRRQARDSGDYATADRLRSELERLGIEVRDTPTGATWTLREDGHTFWDAVRPAGDETE